MTECSVSNINTNIPPGPSLPGFPSVAIQLPMPNISPPFGLTELLDELLKLLKAVWPGGDLLPNIDEFTKTILDGIAKLFNMIAPFLSFYNFIMACFQLIICIINVLCTLTNPFAMASAIATLFSECLPAFLALFPFLALILMILALLLLILALLEYIIEVILAIIAEIIANIIILEQGLTLQDAESTLAATEKIADLTCLIQNLLAIFISLAAILAIIESLAAIAGATICDDGSGTNCCNDSVCPPFIRNAPWGSTLGQLKYYSKIGIDLASVLGISDDEAALFANIDPLRKERWQLLDTASDTPYHFVDIITPIVDTSSIPVGLSKIFYPENSVELDGYASPSSFPYWVDLKLQVNPTQFGISDTEGLREFQIKQCGVTRKPYRGLLNQANQIDATSLIYGASLNLEGGLVYESDGETPFMLADGYQATLNTFIHLADSLTSAVPSSDDGILFENVEYTFNPNYGALMGYGLITASCMPNVAAERAVLNATLVAEDVRAVVDKLSPREPGVAVASTGFLPNVSGTYTCCIDALDTFRKNVNSTTAAELQASLLVCLTDLKDQTSSLYCEALIAAVSQFQSTFTIIPTDQFTSRSIVVSVFLKDAGGNLLTTNCPADCATQIEEKLKGEATLGTISGFKYDGSSLFVAELTSEESGDGTLTVSFDGNVFSTVVTRVDNSNPSEIITNTGAYTFVATETVEQIRRDEGDVARGE